MAPVRVAALVAALAIVGLGGCVVFCKTTYIDETVSSGTGYGFEIGMSKEEAYSHAPDALAGQEVFAAYPLNHQGFGPHVPFSFSEEEYPHIADRDDWKLFLDEGHFNFLVLRFQSDELTEIYRHRNCCEAP